jgi:hypothetical protein
MLRLAIIVAAVAFIGLMAGLASIPLIIRDPLPVVAPRAPASFQYQAGDVTTAAQLQVDRARRFVMILVTDSGRPGEVPTVAFTMPVHDIEPLTPDVQAVSANRFRAAGFFPMPGTWQMTIEQGDQRQSFQFILAE